MCTKDWPCAHLSDRSKCFSNWCVDASVSQGYAPGDSIFDNRHEATLGSCFKFHIYANDSGLIQFFFPSFSEMAKCHGGFLPDVRLMLTEFPASEPSGNVSQNHSVIISVNNSASGSGSRTSARSRATSGKRSFSPATLRGLGSAGENGNKKAWSRVITARKQGF